MAYDGWFAAARDGSSTLIFCHTYNGLANRMRAAVSGLILGRYLDRPVRLIWPAGQGMNCPFDELFEPSGLDFVALPERFTFSRRPRGSLPRGTQVWRDRLGSLTGERFDPVAQLPFVLTAERLKDLPENLCIQTCFAYRPASIGISDYEEAFSETLQQSFRPHRDILDRVMPMPKTTVGVHVRRGDKQTNPALRRMKAGAEVENFYPTMDELAAREPDLRFFVCSDDEGAKETLQARYEGRVLVYPAIVQRRDNAEGIRDAVRELYTLAHTRMILTDGDSSFGPVASRYFRRPFLNMRPEFQGPSRIGTMQAALVSMLADASGGLLQRCWR